MKSMIEYDFIIGGTHQLDLRNLKSLDLTCSDFTLNYNSQDQSNTSECQQILRGVQSKYPTSNLKRLTMGLTSGLNLQFLGQLSNIYQLSNLELTKVSSQHLQTLLGQSHLKLSALTLTLPESGFKFSAQNQGLLITNLLSNGFLRTLSLTFPSSLNDNYLDFTQLILRNKSIATLKLNFSNQTFISDMNLCKYFAYSTILYKLTLSNIQLTNKNAYIQFCLYLSQNGSIQELEINNCIFYEKLKQTFYNCLNERRPLLNTLNITDNHIDSSNISQLCTLIQRNPLKHLELVSILKDRPKMLPIQDIFNALVDKKTLSRLIVKDKLIRLGQSINKAISKFIKSIDHLPKLELDFENYEDIFDQVNHQVQIDQLIINAAIVDKYAVNKLFFDIAQGNLNLSSLKLTGGFTDGQIQKIVHLSMRQSLKELDLSQNQLTDEGAFAISQYLGKAQQLTKLDISQNQIGDGGLVQIFNQGLSNVHRIRELVYGANKFKKIGKIESFKALKTFNHLKILDLGMIIISHYDESEELFEFLEANSTLEEIKMPKIQIEKDEEQGMACYNLLYGIIQHKTLIYASLPFFLKSITTYDQRKTNKEEIYNLQIRSVRKLIIQNCNLDFLLQDQNFSNIPTIQDFLTANQHVWIKYQPPVLIKHRTTKSTFLA